MRTILKKTTVILIITIMVSGLSSCIVLTAPDSESHGGYTYTPSLPSYTPPSYTPPAYTPSAPVSSGTPGDEGEDTGFEDVFVYIGMADSSCIEVKTSCSESFMILRLSEGVRQVFDDLGIETGDQIAVEYAEDGYNSYTVTAISTDIEGPNPGFFSGTYEYEGRIDYSSIEVGTKGSSSKTVFMLTDELKTLLDGFDLDTGDEINVSYIQKKNGNKVIYMIGGPVVNPG